MGSEQADNKMASGLEMLWGVHKQSPRETRPGLTLDAILAAAIAIADEHGLGALSMAAIARKLGFTTMALYRHVPGKAELLMMMTDFAVGVPSHRPDEANGWRAGLELWAREVAARYQEHPWLLEVPVPRMLAMPNQIAWMEAALAILKQTPLQAVDKAAVLLLLSGFLRGREQLVVELGGAADTTGTVSGPDTTNLSDVLRRFVPPERYPETTALIAAGVFDDDTGDQGDDFEFGLARVLDGIETYIASRQVPG